MDYIVTYAITELRVARVYAETRAEAEDMVRRQNHDLGRDERIEWNVMVSTVEEDE